MLFFSSLDIKQILSENLFVELLPEPMCSLPVSLSVRVGLFMSSFFYNTSSVDSVWKIEFLKSFASVVWSTSVVYNHKEIHISSSNKSVMTSCVMCMLTL